MTHPNSTEAEHVARLRKQAEALAEQVIDVDAARHEAMEALHASLARSSTLNVQLRRAREQVAAVENQVRTYVEMCDALRQEVVAAEARAAGADELLRENAAQRETVEALQAEVKGLKAAARRAARKASS